MPKDDINYSFTEPSAPATGGIVYDFYDVFVPADYFRLPSLWIWGRNNEGQLGINNTTSRSTPVTTFSGGTNWKYVSCAYRHTAAIKTDGTLWTWGLNDFGQLGINNSTNKSTPVTTFAGGTNWKSVDCGERYIAAIKTDGTLWLWGRSQFGSLGNNNTTSNANTPVTTFLGGNNWKSVSCGGYHTLALKTDGTLWGWGRDAEGQLGDNDNNQKNTPVTTFLGGNDWKFVSCGDQHSAAIKIDGTLWTWGGGGLNVGQLGDNNTVNRNTPVTTFAGGTNWKLVSCGSNATVGIKTDGTLWTWGSNTNGQLGNNDGNNRTTPVTTFVGGTNWKSISSGKLHVTSIKTDGTLWTWGSNSDGQLGINSIINRSTPVTTILGGSNWKSVSGGGYVTIAIEYEPDP